MKKFILFAIAFAAIVSCAKESPVSGEKDSPVSGENPAEELMEVSLLAYAPGSEVETEPNANKSVLAENGVSVLWEDGDEIKVSFPPRGSSSNSDPKTETSFIFTTTLGADSAEAYFDGSISDLTKYTDGYAFYPTSAVHSASRSGWAITNNYSYDLASEQTEGFGAYNLATSYISKNNIPNHKARAVFLNACALIRIVLSESAKDVVSVTVESNNGVALTGNADLELTIVRGIGLDINADGSVTNNDYSYRLTSPTFSDGGSSEVTLTNGGEPFVPGVEYNIVAWPGTHSGLTFTFYDSEGRKCKKVLSQQVVLEASKYDRFNFKSAFVFAADPVLEVSTTTLTPDAMGATLSFDVTANSNWTITKNANWFSVNPSSGTGNATVNVTFNENLTESAREATITVEHAAGLSRTITVSQETAYVPVVYQIQGNTYLTYASDLTNGLYVIVNKSYSSYVWTESDGKLTTSYRPITSNTFSVEHVFEYKSDASKIDTSIDNYYSWSAGSWKSLSTGKYLDENFNLTADESNALYLVYANNWGGSGGNELIGFDVYHSKTTSSSKYTLWYTGSKFEFGNMNLYYTDANSVNKRKYYLYKVAQQQ